MTVKIPTEQKQFTQPNKSDLFGNISYTKNINFDEDGYMKLSSRSVRIYSEADGGAFDLPASFGRLSSGVFQIISADQPFKTSLVRNSSALAVQDTDTAAPDLDFDSTGCWYRNRWHTVDDAGNLFYKSGSTWTDTTVNLTVGVTHAMEVFRNKGYLAVSDGNTVKLYDSSYSLQVTLTIPTDYEIIGLAYSNNRLGVSTILSDTVGGQNQEAFFFVWDGASTSAQQGFPVGSDGIVSIVAYRSSWVILTRAGQLLMWNGGGFDELATLQYYSDSLQWGGASSKLMYGSSMVVDGDKIYINIPTKLNNFGAKDEVYLSTYPGGVLCYDPKVGIYHRYSPSNSTAKMCRVPDSGVNTTTNTFTKNLGTLPATGNPVMYTYDRATAIGGLKIGTVYYIINVDGTDFKLATTKENAEAGTSIDITSVGATNNYFVTLDVVDYGIALSPNRTAGIALIGATDIMYDKVIFGGDASNIDSSSDTSATLYLTIPFFKNIGYAVTPKIESDNITDLFKKIYIKYRDLGVDDKITVKYKTKDVVGLPVTTPQRNGVRCVWTSTTTFTTTADISEADTYLDTAGNELECELIDGAGAGQMSQISSIVESGGTYTVTLSTELDGITIGYYSDILIENWKVLKTARNETLIDYSSQTDGVSEFSVGNIGNWVKFKIILEGVETTISQIQIPTKSQISAL